MAEYVDQILPELPFFLASKLAWMRARAVNARPAIGWCRRLSAARRNRSEERPGVTHEPLDWLRETKRMLTKKRPMFVVTFLVVGAAVAWAASDWSSARSAAEDMKTRQQDLRKLAPEETRHIVTAICEADEDARESAGKAAANVSRALSTRSTKTCAMPVTTPIG